MPNPVAAFSALMMLLAGPALVVSDAPAPAPAWDRAAGMMQHVTVMVPRITITSTTTIITSGPVPAPPAPRAAKGREAPMFFREKKADDCIKMKKIRGFMVNTPESIDLLLDDGVQLRAHLGSNCPALGFYTGFYVKPNPDGKICVGRDLLRSRMGKTCGLDQFSKLVPVKVK